MSDASGLSDTNNPENSDQDDTKDKEIDDPDHVEERFRVDRRRLEEMIQSPGSEGEDGTADDFFHRVMEATNTRITWPSKLKIGAKSKKDPHIKVCGHRDNVATAKDKIMAVLDMKSSRVTLKMDVSHTEHSHVIGKGGNNIKRVMQETGCHIHFPDSNRNLQAEKSNQVSIAGQPKGVEQAQAKIRELLPLVFMFELPLAGLLQPMVDATSPQIQQIQNTYGVTISFKQRTRVYASTTVIVRGSVCNAKSVKEATVVLIEHLTGSVGNAMPVSMQLEIAPQHHHFIIGRSGANIKQIMQQTGATIHFPDPSTTPAQRKGTVYITGAVESVLLARHQLIGCLPLVLMFDMKEDIPIEQPRISQLMEQLDVYISIKPKPKQPSKSVIVKSIERNTQNLYAARKWLLGLIDDNELLTTHNNNVDRTKTFCSAVYRPVMLLASPQAAFPLAPAAAAAAYAVYPPNGLIIKDAKLLKKDLKTPNEPVLKPMDAKVSISSPGVNTGTAPLVLSPAKQLPPSVDFKPVATNQQPPFSPKRHEVRVPVAEVRKAPTPIQDCPSLESHDSISVSVSSPLDLLTSAMSSSLLSDAQALGAITGNLPFSKSDLQDAVSSIQSKPDILERLLPTQPRPEKTRGILPNNTQPGKISSDTGSQGIAGDLFGRKLNSDFGPLPPQGFGTGTVLNSSQSSMAPPRRVKTPPGFSGHHKESSPLRELFDSQFQANIGAAAQQQRTNPKPPSPLGLPSPMNNIRYGQDSPLGCLGSPLGSGGSPLQGGSPLMTPVSPSMYMGRRLYQNGDTARSSESGDSDGSDCRAPGSNRPTRLTSPPPPLFSPTMTMFESFDYEQKKLLATKAMQKKPEGESRIPTDFWSGLGFSKSMPDSAIRERLKSSNVQRYNGPTMTTTYENAGDEIDGDPWRDTISEETEPDGVSPSSSTNHLVNHEDPNREEHSLLANNRHDEYISTAQDWPPKTDLAELFSKLGLGKYTDLFTQQEIDLVTFTTLTDLDLKELGISTFGARRKMLIAIADLNKRGTLPIAATTSSKLANSTTTTTHHYGGTDHSNHGNPFRDGGSHLMHSSSRRQDIASQSGRW